MKKTHFEIVSGESVEETSRASVLIDRSKVKTDVLEYYRVTKTKKDQRRKDEIASAYKFVEGSKQIADPFTGLYGKIIEPPYDMSALNKLQEISTYHAKAIRIKAWDVVGRGWYFEPEDENQNPEAYREVKELLDNPGDDSFMEILRRVMIDFNSTGMGVLEVIRDEPGRMTAFSHIPSYTIRVTKDGRYVQQRGQSKRWFRTFGGEPIDSETGEGGEVGFERRANEVIVWINYCPWNDYYGMPEYVSAIPTIWMDKLREDYNLDFFENHAVPAYSIIVTGTSVSKEVEDKIKDYFQTHLRQNRHSTLLLVFKKNKGEIDQEQIKVDFKKLEVDVKEASFRMLRQDNIAEILSAHGVPPYRAGVVLIGALGQNVAFEVNEMYKDNIIEPMQQMVEDTVNMKILGEFEVRGWRWRFEDIDLTDEMMELDKDIKLFTNGAKTPNDLIRTWGGQESTEESMDAYYINGVPITGEVARAREEMTQETFIEEALEMQKGIGEIIKKSLKEEV
jgi:PBSX family phage portal protein